MHYATHQFFMRIHPSNVLRLLCSAMIFMCLCNMRCRQPDPSARYGPSPVLDHSRDETRFFETVRYTVRAEDKQAQRGICLSPNQANPVRSPLGAKCAFSLQDGLPRGQLRGTRRITTPRRRSIRYPANYEDSDASQCLCGRWIGLSRFYVLVACQDVCIFDA